MKPDALVKIKSEVYQMKYILAAFLMMTLARSAVPAIAHHATTAFYHQDRWTEIEGIVQGWLFRNPHPVLYVEAPDADGQLRVFEIGFPPATILTKRGWSRETFREGQVVRAKGHPSKAPGTYGLSGAAIHRADGTEVR